ncbi:MAG: AAA family ATPase [Firmicutes bacterium]|nr:AAA family ATPase [Bacillota bacterium]MCM1401365.1 AAA family ATPase [Bacteroides sp.]MCM1477390.1 AAA family ATPase [Bacteroides sp.]
MNTHEFAERIFLNLPYLPNNQQIELIAALARFCSPNAVSDSVFLLNGYAGTGKTSLTGALVRALREAGVPVVLLAPTGRAAKVFARFARFPASTIHRRIYRGTEGGLNSYAAEVADNTLTGAVFIVDEASMIGDSGASTHPEARSLLEDLVHYVYSGEGCRMILLGDTAQLPPVGCEQSPAMNVEKLKSFGLRVTRAVLTKVVRQARASGILYNATRLRKTMLLEPRPIPNLVCKGFADVRAVTGEELSDEIAASYSQVGIADTLLVTRSNKRATQFNLAIRTNILGREEELSRDELLLVAKNNYLWSAKVKGLDFVANGDTAVIDAIYGTEEKYGFRFADVNLRLPDRDIAFDCKILLDTLVNDTAALEPERYNALYMAALNDPDIFTPATPMRTRMKMLRSDPYVNAIQVKYAYAVTCHKAQGGQWRNVFVDMGFIPADAYTTLDFYRWLYTAVTRATGTLSLVNPGSLLSESEN